MPFSLDKASGLFPYPGANIRDDFLSRLYDPQGLPLSLNDLYNGRIPPHLGADAGLLAAAAASFPGVVPGFPSPFNLGLPPPMAMGPRSEGAIDVRDRESPASSVGSRSPSPHSINEEQLKMKSTRLSCSSGDGECERDADDEVGGQGGGEETDVDATLKCSNDGCNRSFVTKHDKAKHERRCYNHNSGEKDSTTYVDGRPTANRESSPC